MNKIMGDAWMVGFYFEQIVQNGNGFTRVLTLVTISGRQQRQSVKNRSFMVLRIFFIQPRHGFCVDVQSLVVVGVRSVENCECANVIPFALRFGFEALSLLNQTCSLLQVRIRGTAPKLMKQAHGASPVSHRASRVCLRYLLKLIVGFLVGKGVEQRDPTLKRLLHCWRAGCRKRNRAQLFIGIKMMVLIIEGEGERG